MKNKNLIIILMMLTITFTIMGGTLAYFTWQTSESQKTELTFTIDKKMSCSADIGGTISSNDTHLMPDSCTGTHAIKRTLTTKTQTINNNSIYMDLWLDVNEIGTGLTNSNNFKYALTTSDTSCETGLVTSGTFTGTSQGDKIELLSSNEYNDSTTNTYYLYIWLDSAETSTETQSQSFSLSLNGECTDEAKAYSESILNGATPELDDGMIPVVIDNSGSETTVKTIKRNDSNWYSYENKEWANIVLTTNDSRSKYLNTTGVSVSESDILAYLVWIPRYKYKIWTMTTSSNGNEQTIDIIFEDKTTTKSIGTTVGSYRTHPAFTFGNTELNGIWVGKFETTGSSAGYEIAGTPIEDLSIKPNSLALRTLKVSMQFETAQKFGTSEYGSTSKVDAHMMKNSEWGATAYLAHSIYGIDEEMYSNNSTGYYTGRSAGEVRSCYANTSGGGAYTWDGKIISYGGEIGEYADDRTLGTKASTTGNITGIYDMSGGTLEYVMGYYSGASTTWGASRKSWEPTTGTNYADFSSKPDSKYYDDYTTTSSLTACNNGICYGHALSETAGWYDREIYSLSTSSPWILRGGGCYGGVWAETGELYAGFGTGNLATDVTFRSVIVYID